MDITKTFDKIIKLAGDVIDIAGDIGTIGSIVDIVRKSVRKKKERDIDSLKNLFWETYYGVALDEFNRRVNQYCGSRVGKRFWKLNNENNRLPRFDFNRYLYMPPNEQTNTLVRFYEELFCSMQNIMREENLTEEENIEKIFEDIVNSATKKWEIALFQLFEEYPVFGNWIGYQWINNLGNQIDGNNLTFCQMNGYDKHLYQRRVNGEYWHQSIKFEGSDDDGISARPEVQKKQEDSWWEELSSRLSQAPLFLVGPGGIGKSAFLAYLYETIVNNRIGREFEGVFLLSLDTVISNIQHPIDRDAEALNKSENSILLNHIACRSGDGGTSRGWKEMLQNGDWLYMKKPILLLLDGFNEMSAKKWSYPNEYEHLKEEIIALSNYKYVRIILTSRVESGDKTKDELTAQRGELSMMHFQVGHLGGISEDVPENIDLSDEMRTLLKRPLYYGHIQYLLGQNKVPSNRYEALQAIYEGMSNQCIANGATESIRLFRKCMFEFLFPIIAYYGWRNKKLTDAEIDTACGEFAGQCCRKLISNHPETRRFYRFKYEMDIKEFMTSQEQLLADTGDQYVFSHQDYQDFLVAKYFLQRMDYMRSHLDEPFWSDKSIASNLRPNTYGNDILALIYQAISFHTNFVKYFRLVPDEIAPERIDQITPGHILWYNAAYQLSDLTGPAGFDYGNRDLDADTLQVLRPLAEYVYEESLVGPQFDTQPITECNDLLKKHIAEILMKTCGIYRKNRNLERARQMADAAEYVYRENPDKLPHIVEHNIAHIDLCDFRATGNRDCLTSSLERLLKCATGSEKIPPQRYSCSMLSMLLISPQNVLKRTTEYQDFISMLLREKTNSIVLFAFWKAYDAIFNCDKFAEENDWTPRLYYVRQFLFLLAENRVQIVNSPDCAFTESDYFNLKRQNDLGRIKIYETPAGAAPIPAEGNLRLIRIALKIIAGYEQPIEKRYWITYLKGLVEYKLNNNKDASRDQFTKVLDAVQDIRTQLWIAYLNDDKQKLEAVHNRGREIAQRAIPQEINSYHLGEYYERDITALYHALQSQPAN